MTQTVSFLLVYRNLITDQVVCRACHSDSISSERLAETIIGDKLTLYATNNPIYAHLFYLVPIEDRVDRYDMRYIMDLDYTEDCRDGQTLSDLARACEGDIEKAASFYRDIQSAVAQNPNSTSLISLQ